MDEDLTVKRVKGSGTRLAYDTIRDEILTLKLEPGQLLDETTLAERFKMSRSPIREALIRLSGEELVLTLQNRSTVVAPLEITSLPKYVEALDLAQRINTRLAAELRSDEDLVVMRNRQEDFVRAVNGGNHLQMSEANLQFHMSIATAGRNPYLASFYERILNQGRRMLHLHFEYIERSQDGYLLTNEHDEMLDAIEQRDVERADKLAHAHTRQFQSNFMDFMMTNFGQSMRLADLANGK